MSLAGGYFLLRCIVMLLAYVRTILLYLVLILSVRLMGKRQVGQLETSEFVVAMVMADLAAVPMQDGALPLISGVVPLLTILGLELVFSFLVLIFRSLAKFFDLFWFLFGGFLFTRFGFCLAYSLYTHGLGQGYDANIFFKHLSHIAC